MTRSIRWWRDPIRHGVVFNQYALMKAALAAAYVVLSTSAIAVPIVLAGNNPQADENVLLLVAHPAQ